ncbi:Tungsten-containing aldehyde ferredoxin oxidoreductase cofactor modifying protein [Methanosarcina sp. Kolksee]|nr:Tungsten-containing aldehyde ferredoxin oxidoreductase cofactor modifying protein [Methanosarcina sp. Kolksee]
MYGAQEAHQARNSNKLLAIRLETNKSCNLRCRYCYAQSGEDSAKIADFNNLKRIIQEAKELGIRSVVVIGGGEPTLYPSFRDLIAYIDSLEIIPVIFSNTVLMTEELAEFLYKHNASVMGKLDSLKPEVQDYLAGRAGAYEDIRKGLWNLLKAGFSKPAGPGKLRLGVSFVSNKMNLEEIEEIWHFCRQNNIFPNMEILTPTGRANDELEDKLLTADEIKEYKLKLLEIDQKYYGYDWLPYTPITASGCLQHLYSLYINIEGNVRPCAPTKLDEHPALRVGGEYPYNVNKMSLREIYNSDLFTYVRNIDKMLEGRCRNCEHNEECIGCRGYAYSVGIKHGIDPLKALRMECQQCFK